MQYVDKLACWYDGFAERVEAHGFSGSRDIAALIKLASVINVMRNKVPVKLPVPPAGVSAPEAVQTEAPK